MILRVSAKLGKKIHVNPTRSLPADENPFADWTAHLFTADRTQYVLVSNTASLYSFAFYGKGVTDDHHLITRMTTQLREHLEDDGLPFIYERLIMPTTGRVSFIKPLNRSVTGSMNQLVAYAKILLVEEEFSPYGLSSKLNDHLLSYLEHVIPGCGYATPMEAFRRLSPAQTAPSSK